MTSVLPFLTRRPQTKKEVATMAARLHRRSTHVHETAQALDATAERMRLDRAHVEQQALGLVPA